MSPSHDQVDRPGDCVVHAGMIKTGTTSLQSSLLKAAGGNRFRLLTLDSFFGNVLVGSAFAGDYGIGERFISQAVDARMAAKISRRSHEYLAKSLEAAARHRCTPIISAEIIGSLPRDAIGRLRAFLVERGWQPRVIVYVRAPLDLLESRFQQRLRAGDIPSRIPQKMPAYLERSRRGWYSAPLDSLDAAFGRDHVTPQWYDPRRFPGQCVVRHFCDFAGIPIQDGDIVRANDSLSLDAVRFVYALMLANACPTKSRIDRLRRAILMEHLADLNGPPLRFHPKLIAPFVESIEPERAVVESRMREVLPLSLHQRREDEGVRCEADLLDFSAESLDWLAKASGGRVVRCRQPSDSVNAVVEQLQSISTRFPSRIAGRVVMARAHELWQRARGRWRNLR